MQENQVQSVKIEHIQQQKQELLASSEDKIQANADKKESVIVESIQNKKKISNRNGTYALRYFHKLLLDQRRRLGILLPIKQMIPFLTQSQKRLVEQSAPVIDSIFNKRIQIIQQQAINKYQKYIAPIIDTLDQKEQQYQKEIEQIKNIKQKYLKAKILCMIQKKRGYLWKRAAVRGFRILNRAIQDEHLTLRQSLVVKKKLRERLFSYVNQMKKTQKEMMEFINDTLDRKQKKFDSEKDLQKQADENIKKDSYQIGQQQKIAETTPDPLDKAKKNQEASFRSIR